MNVTVELNEAEKVTLNLVRAATYQRRALLASQAVWCGEATALRTAAAAKILGRLEGLGLVKATAHGYIAKEA